MLWWIGNILLLVAVVPILVWLLNRVLAALERIRGAADDIPRRWRCARRRTRGGPRDPGGHRRHRRRCLVRRRQVRRLRREAVGVI